MFILEFHHETSVFQDKDRKNYKDNFIYIHNELDLGKEAAIFETNSNA